MIVTDSETGKGPAHSNVSHIGCPSLYRLMAEGFLAGADISGFNNFGSFFFQEFFFLPPQPV